MSYTGNYLGDWLGDWLGASGGQFVDAAAHITGSGSLTATAQLFNAAPVAPVGQSVRYVFFNEPQPKPHRVSNAAMRTSGKGTARATASLLRLASARLGGSSKMSAKLSAPPHEVEWTAEQETEDEEVLLLLVMELAGHG